MAITNSQQDRLEQLIKQLIEKRRARLLAQFSSIKARAELVVSTQEPYKNATALMEQIGKLRQEQKRHEQMAKELDKQADDLFDAFFNPGYVYNPGAEDVRKRRDARFNEEVLEYMMKNEQFSTAVASIDKIAADMHAAITVGALGSNMKEVLSLFMQHFGEDLGPISTKLVEK